MLHNAATIQIYSHSEVFMGLKKTAFNDDEIAIYDEAVVYLRGEYWQMRMWLQSEKKYARFSLKTKNRSTAIDKAKKHYHELMSDQMAGKRYFSLTTKQGVEMYTNARAEDVEAGLIVKGRLGTIKTHLSHWLDFIGRDIKLKELERTDCENYYHKRTKTKRNISISQTTVMNEQSTINAMIAWLYKRGETHIDEFFFKKLPKIDKGLQENRRQTFTPKEARDIHSFLEGYVRDAMKDLTSKNNVYKALAGCYFGVALNTGLRSGEQRQLCWSDVTDLHLDGPLNISRAGGKDGAYDALRIVVRGVTSKVKTTRAIIIKDNRTYFKKLQRIAMSTRNIKMKTHDCSKLGDDLVFSCDGNSMLTKRQISYHFYKVIELAGIEIGNRSIVPYSTRHYFITQRINSGLDLMAVAGLAGTSAVQIERTYYHTSESKMFNEAFKDYEDSDVIVRASVDV